MWLLLVFSCVSYSGDCHNQKFIIPEEPGCDYYCMEEICTNEAARMQKKFDENGSIYFTIICRKADGQHSEISDGAFFAGDS